MKPLAYVRAHTLGDALAALRERTHARPLAGGQSVLPAIRLGLVATETLIDLQDIAGLREMFIADETLSIGAMCTHNVIARSDLVRGFCPMLSSLAGGIADQQVRNRGTIGGSVANNDPSACWPTALLALDAVIVTTQREIPAARFFIGVYETTLRDGELIVAIQFRKPLRAHYIKYEQAASRFALVGVAVAQFETTPQARVAFTGLGHGVSRWPQAEDALNTSFTPRTIESLVLAESNATTDMHASAQYRVHLARVLTRRCVAHLCNASYLSPLAPQASIPVAQFEGEPLPLSGTQTISASRPQVWAGLFAPQVLERCVPGCESVEAIAPDHFRTRARVGLGMIAVHIVADIRTSIEKEGERCTLAITYDAGGFGAGAGLAQISLHALENYYTRLDWRARATPTGKLAQLGNRLIEASTQKLTADFFSRFNAVLKDAPPTITLSQRLRTWMQSKNH